MILTEVLMEAVQDGAVAVLSLPSYVHMCLVHLLEQLLVLLSLVLNAYVCILFVKTWKWPEKEKKPDEDRVLAIETFINNHSKTLEANDVEKDGNDDTYWHIPKPGTKMNSEFQERNKTNLRPIDDECAICMNQYTCGDRINWSANPNCMHCFHSDCITAWLLPSEPRNQLCPCCRQSYCQPVETETKTC